MIHLSDIVDARPLLAWIVRTARARLRIVERGVVERTNAEGNRRLHDEMGVGHGGKRQSRRCDGRKVEMHGDYVLLDAVRTGVRARSCKDGRCRTYGNNECNLRLLLMSSRPAREVGRKNVKRPFRQKKKRKGRARCSSRTVKRGREMKCKETEGGTYMETQPRRGAASTV